METLYIADNYYEKSIAFSMEDNVNKFLSAGFFPESWNNLFDSWKYVGL